MSCIASVQLKNFLRLPTTFETKLGTNLYVAKGNKNMYACIELSVFVSAIRIGGALPVKIIMV